MTELVDKLRALAERITPGPWQAVTANYYAIVGDAWAAQSRDQALDVYVGAPREGNEPRIDSVLALGADKTAANAEFIALVRNHLPDILAMADALEQIAEAPKWEPATGGAARELQAYLAGCFERAQRIARTALGDKP